MTDHSSKTSLLYFLEVVSGDIESLERLANQIADEEKDHLNAIIGLGHLTTPPLGAPAPRAKQVGTKSRCTVPLAMTCFSVLDFIGRLMFKVEEEKQKSVKSFKIVSNKKPVSAASSKEKDSFILHTRSFLRILTTRGNSVLNDTNAEILQNAYRHSIAHAFLPSSKAKYGYCIAYSNVFDSFVLFHQLDYFGEEYPSGALVLNVVCLARLVKEGIQRLKDLLNTEDATSIQRQYESFLEDNSL